jgi:hypothetical protein
VTADPTHRDRLVPSRPRWVDALAWLSGGPGVVLFAVGLGVGVGVVFGSPLGAMLGVVAVFGLAGLVFPLVARRAGWTWGLPQWWARLLRGRRER